MIRFAKAEDLNDIYKLVCLLENTELDYEAFSDIYKAKLSDFSCPMLVYEENEKVTGFLNMKYDYQLHHCEKVCEIVEFIVEEGYRGNGMGQQLFEYACNMSRESGCCQIELSCNQKRKNAHRFYEKCGMINSHYRFVKRI